METVAGTIAMKYADGAIDGEAENGASAGVKGDAPG